MTDDVNALLDSTGGKWFKLRTKADGVLKGTILDLSVRGKTFEGQPVLNRKTGEQRQEVVVTLQTDLREDAEDDGIRNFGANEAAQRALAEAKRQAGAPLAVGGTLAITVEADPANDREQATYRAQYQPPSPANDLLGSDTPAPAPATSAADLL